MRYYFSHDHASCLFFADFFAFFEAPRSVDDIERKQFKFGKHYASHDEVKICMGSYVWRFVTPMFRLLPQNFWFELTVCIYNIYDIYTYGMIPYDCATVRTVFLFRRNRPKNWPPEAGKDSILFDLISSCLLHRASL